MSEEKPDFKKPLTPGEKIMEKITEGVERSERKEKEPLLNADELKKILEDKNE